MLAGPEWPRFRFTAEGGPVMLKSPTFTRMLAVCVAVPREAVLLSDKLYVPTLPLVS